MGRSTAWNFRRNRKVCAKNKKALSAGRAAFGDAISKTDSQGYRH
jgi:hypothetical protein